MLNSALATCVLLLVPQRQFHHPSLFFFCIRRMHITQASLTPENAAESVARLIALCRRESRPVYFSVPLDSAETEAHLPAAAAAAEPPAPVRALRADPRSDERALEEAAQKVAKLCVRFWLAGARPSCCRP